MNVLAIDPGFAGKGCAFAIYVQGTLRSTWFQRDHGNACAWRADVVVVERPAYQGQRSDAARVADLIGLAWAGALLAGAYAGRDGAELVELTPAQWKGSEQKPIQHARLWTILSASERAVLGGDATARRIHAAQERGALNRWGKPGAAYYGAWTGHNLLDAAALGAHHLGRLARK